MDDKTGATPPANANDDNLNGGAGAPTDPTTPDVSAAPVTPDVSATPTSPSTPTDPTTPSAPNDSVNSISSTAPETPETSASATSPTAPSSSDTSAAPTEPAVSAAPIGQVVPTNSDNPTNPTASPASTAPTPAAIATSPAPTAPDAPKKKKIGLIAGIAGGVAALVAVVVVGVVVAINLNADPVAKAIDKILSGGLPGYIQVDGNVDIVANTDNLSSGSASGSTGSGYNATGNGYNANGSGKNSYSPNSPNDGTTSSSDGGQTLDCSFPVSGSLALATYVNQFSVQLNCEATGEAPAGSLMPSDFSLSAEERYPGDDKLYFRIDGLSNLLNSVEDLMSEQQEDAMGALYESEDEDEFYDEDGDLYADDYYSSTTYGTDLVSGILGMFKLVFGAIDGQWLSVDATDLKQNIDSSCEVQFVKKLQSGGATLGDVYHANPFIESTDENIAVASKDSKVFKLSINREKYQSFWTALDGTGQVSDYKSCLQKDGREFKLNTLPENIPEVYTEVDGKYNFSRLYTTMQVEDAGSVTVDLGLSYPDAINVETPKDAEDAEELFNSLFSGFGMGSSGLGTSGSGVSLRN